MMIKFISQTDKDMSNGMRNLSHAPLNDKEIQFVKKEIARINADETIFVFNDNEHIGKGTCYDYLDDKIYIGRNVFPDMEYSSTHPRDIMSVGAVLAHEYYGHRTYRQEYISDFLKDELTTPDWQDECRASITASKITPNLSEREKSDLVMDAIYRAKEYGQYIEMDDYMKEVVYGYPNGEKNIVPTITPIKYVSEKSVERDRNNWNDGGRMPEMRHASETDSE